VLTVFKRRCQLSQFGDVVMAFDDSSTIVHAGDDVQASAYLDVLAKVPALRRSVTDLAAGESPGAVASAVEFVLEGLHLSRRLNKESVGARSTYRGR
jgi:magnesium chelatase subunit I